MQKQKGGKFKVNTGKLTVSLSCLNLDNGQTWDTMSADPAET